MPAVRLLSEQVEEAASFIRGQAALAPAVGIVLGSGLGNLAEEVEQPSVLASADIPHFCPPTVEGHLGHLVLGTLEGVAVAVLQGRSHFYEGCGAGGAVMHVWTLRRLGCHTLILTNAAGALNPRFWPGDVMLITDHINLPGLVGHNPLFGSQYSPGLGPRFVDMGGAYDESLGRLTSDVAAELDLDLRRGVYIMVSGPSYETQAELRFLRAMGGDAVGMSTANETVAARQCGLRVLGLSGISNQALRAMPARLTHAEVLAVGEVLRPKFSRLIRGLLRRMSITPAAESLESED